MRNARKLFCLSFTYASILVGAWGAAHGDAFVMLSGFGIWCGSWYLVML